ncbi:MAG: hypothetical protein EHM36_06910, partial [Deltaproteobacteria bacterium]
MVGRDFSKKLLLTIFLLACPLLVNTATASEQADESRILAVVKRVESAFKALRDYTCDVEQVFYREGAEDQHYRFKLLFKKTHKIRVEFSDPYPSLTVLYREGEHEVTVIPFRFLRGLKFRFSI